MALTKAFIISGGTPNERECIRRQLIQDEAFLMLADFASPDKSQIAVAFGGSEDLRGVTFDAIKRSAGTTQLPANFRTSVVDRDHCFGVISLG